ncbi:MAG: hypothetical protein WAN23_08560 [Candidatus Acidiferrales bacterium]
MEKSKDRPCFPPVEKFTQIVDASGWRAVFRGPDGEVIEQPLVCFALGSDGEVYPMSFSDGLVCELTFDGYESEWLLLDPLQEVTDELREKFRAEAKPKKFVEVAL